MSKMYKEDSCEPYPPTTFTQVGQLLYRAKQDTRAEDRLWLVYKFCFENKFYNLKTEIFAP